MEFRTLGKKERKLLLTAIDFDDLTKLHCQYCDDGVHYANCGIMPPIKTKKLATILCDSELCMAQYLEDIENLTKHNSSSKKDCRFCINHINNSCGLCMDMKRDNCEYFKRSPS